MPQKRFEIRINGIDGSLVHLVCQRDIAIQIQAMVVPGRVLKDNILEITRDKRARRPAHRAPLEFTAPLKSRENLRPCPWIDCVCVDSFCCRHLSSREAARGVMFLAEQRLWIKMAFFGI